MDGETEKERLLKEIKFLTGENLLCRYVGKHDKCVFTRSIIQKIVYSNFRPTTMK